MIKRQNSINLSEIPAKRNDGLLICLNCDKLLPKRRQKYCSDECYYDWATKHNQNLMRSKFIKKTKGFCNHCKQQPIKREDRYPHLTNKEWQEIKQFTQAIKFTNEYVILLDNTKLILDHIKPIALGGGEFDESNLQILCLKCNKIKTAKDFIEIAKARRIEKIMSNGQKSLAVNKKEDGLPPTDKSMGIRPTILGQTKIGDFS